MVLVLTGWSADFFQKQARFPNCHQDQASTEVQSPSKPSFLRTRDSGFNSEHPSLFPLSEADDASAATAGSGGGDNSHCHTGSDIPSAIFGDAELPSCFLENYGLDGPLEDPKSQVCTATIEYFDNHMW